MESHKSSIYIYKNKFSSEIIKKDNKRRKSEIINNKFNEYDHDIFGIIKENNIITNEIDNKWSYDYEEYQLMFSNRNKQNFQSIEIPFLLFNDIIFDY